MTWVQISATGIVVHPFIAATRPQISLLVGDQFQLLAECENWYRGKNILTEIDGIFPKSCIKIFHGRLGANSKCDFMLKQEDLLQTEARITLRYALRFMKTSVNLINVVKVGERIQTVVEKLKYLNSFNTSSNLTNIRQSVPISSDNAAYRPKSYSFCTRKENNDISNLRNSIKNYRSSICSNDDKSSMFYKMNTLYDRVLEAHQQLACSLDELRESMKIEPRVRSSYLHAFPTITTWGEEQFPVSHSSAGKQNHKHVEKPPEYVMFHINAEILNPRKTQYFKFSLYQPMRPPWLSQVHSCILGPENTTCNVVFGGLEKRDMKTVIYLVIYVYDILINDAFPEIDINDSELLMNAPREIIGCNIVQLPSCKTDLAFKRGPTILDFHTRTSSIEFLYSLHDFLISNDMNCAQTLKNILPDLKLKFTPTFGQRNDYLMKSGLNSNCFVYPMFLPSVITTSFIRSTITITIHSLTQHSSRKRSRIVCRILDKSNNQFLKIIQNPLTGEYNSDCHISVCFRGLNRIPIGFSETFHVSVLNFDEEEMKNLFVTFEIQRYVSFNENKLSSSSYTTIPLSSTVGNIHNVNNAMAPLHHFQFKNRPNLPSPEEFMFPPQGYDAGCIDYSLNISSTKFTSFDPLYKLIHFTEFPDEIASSLMNFMQLGLSEISKFIKEIAASLCLIMVAKKEFCKEAFKKLTNVFAEVLTRGRSEYIDQLDLFVDTFLSETRPMNEFDLNNLSKLYEQLLPNIISMISTDDTTQDFRNIIKCSPYFLKMSSMSIVLQRKIHPNLVNWKSIIGKIVILFTKLTEIISEVPSEEVGIQRKGLVFTNQQLILFHFSKMISAILICIQPEIVANIVINFITSIRYVIKDRKQITIDKSKLRILKSLALTQLWTSSQSRAMMEQIYQSELVKASTLPHCIPFIVPILSSLYLTVRNSFIVKFSSLLVKCYRSEMEIVNNSSSPAAISTSKMNILNMTKLLLLIANTFYVNFPIKEMLDLINIDLIGPKDRLFAFINFLHVRQDILVQPNIPEDEKIRIIKSFLDLSIHARTEKCSHLDRLLYSCIYPKLIDYQICKKVFFSLSTTSQASPILIRPLLHCFMNDKSTDLKLIFMRIVQASDENVELDLLNETLVAAYELSHYPNFFFLVEFFENIESFRNLDQKSFSFFIQFKYIISALNDIAVFSDNKDVLIQNSENLTDAINTVIKICKDAGSESILSKLILEQTQLHLSAENYLEAANSYMSLIDHIPCNHEPVEKMFQIDEALTGIEVHINVMLKCIDLYTKASYEELGLEVIKRLKNEVIRKFKYFELMKKVNEKEAELLQRISSEERNFSNFFYVRFFGDIPNEHYQKNKMFIYRRSDKVNLKAMIMELSHKFPKCKIDFKPPKDENATYIQVIPVSISWEEEVENPFSRQKINLNARKYIIKYQIFKKVNVFRAERFLSIGQEPQSQQQHQLLQRRNTYRSKIKNPGTHFPQALEQVFLFTKQSFPGIATRFEIDQSKTVVRVLSPIDSAILLVRRRSLKLMIDIQHIKKLFDSGSKYLDLIEQDGCFNLFEQGMSKVVDDLASGQILWFVETFIKGRISSPAIVNNNPKKITALKDTIKELLTIVYNGINVDESIQGEEGKANIQRIERIFQNSRKLIEPYL